MTIAVRPKGVVNRLAQIIARRWAGKAMYAMAHGLTEPLFVPEYWSPPSLFDLARRTGFDVESLIFSFGIGGIGAVLYSLLTRQRLEPTLAAERRRPRHRFHAWALAALAESPVVPQSR